jgi:hypothetical protein
MGGEGVTAANYSYKPRVEATNHSGIPTIVASYTKCLQWSKKLGSFPPLGGRGGDQMVVASV